VVAVLLLDLATLERGGLAARDEVSRARLRALPLSERLAQDLVEALRGAAEGGVASPAQTLVFQRRGISLDRLRQAVEVNGAAVDLTRREYDLLQVFMRDPGRPLHRNRLVAEAWGGEGDGNLLDVHMSRLRAKIAAPLGRPAFKTVRGVGYQLL
jgi:DNA-binding response OmpR family regulator